jgi:hypothetical protein
MEDEAVLMASDDSGDEDNMAGADEDSEGEGTQSPLARCCWSRAARKQGGRGCRLHPAV